MQFKACNATAHHTLKNEVDLILQKFYEGWKNKRGIFNAIITGFKGLALKGFLVFCITKHIMPYTKQLKLCQSQWTCKEINSCI